MRIRPAEKKDLLTIVEWRADRATWLAERGEDQWSETGLSSDEFTNRVATSIQEGETWMLVDYEPSIAGEQAKGTIAVDQWSDTGLWTENQLEESVIAHRMIVPVEYRGQLIGDRLLAFASELARRAEKRFVRLDAWTNNRHLHTYYLRRGFRHVRTEHVRRSGALFELAVPPAKQLRWEVSARPWFASVATSSDRRHVAQPWCFLPQLRVQHSSVSSGCPSVTDAHRYRLRWDGVSWRWCDLGEPPHIDQEVLPVGAGPQLDTRDAYDVHPVEPTLAIEEPSPTVLLEGNRT